MRVVAFTYEASEHCPDCAVERFGTEANEYTVPDEATDNEGNPVGVIFSTDEFDRPMDCGTCGEMIEGTER